MNHLVPLASPPPASSSPRRNARRTRPPGWSAPPSCGSGPLHRRRTRLLDQGGGPQPGSIKDRSALHMVLAARARADCCPAQASTGSTIFGQHAAPRLVRGLGSRLHPRNVANGLFGDPLGRRLRSRPGGTATGRSHYAPGGWGGPGQEVSSKTVLTYCWGPSGKTATTRSSAGQGAGPPAGQEGDGAKRPPRPPPLRRPGRRRHPATPSGPPVRDERHRVVQRLRGAQPPDDRGQGQVTSSRGV